MRDHESRDNDGDKHVSNHVQSDCALKPEYNGEWLMQDVFALLGYP